MNWCVLLATNSTCCASRLKRTAPFVVIGNMLTGHRTIVEQVWGLQQEDVGPFLEFFFIQMEEFALPEIQQVRFKEIAQ